jgi:predicted ester cyclase
MSILEANKALVRRVFEEVIPAGDAVTMRALFVPDFLDHDPLPGQPRGADGAAYVVRTMHGAHPDLRFTVDDLVAEGDRVIIRWTLRATNTGALFGRQPSGAPVEYAAIVIFRIADGLIAERWAAWKPGYAPTGPPVDGPTNAKPAGRTNAVLADQGVLS